MNTTALVHEAYLELAECGDLDFRDRTHFFAAAQTMRHILIDYAVRRKAQKRGGGLKKVPFEHITLASDDQIEDLITLDQAVRGLEIIDQRLVRVVERDIFLAQNSNVFFQTIGRHASAGHLHSSKLRTHPTEI